MSISKNKYTNLQKSLVIVESPAKCKKIEEYLGVGYKCIASYGHLRELSSLKNIHIKENIFTPEFTIIDNSLKKKQIEILRKEITNSREIILATDDDREGEAIAWHICILFNLNPQTTKRIIFHEITKSAIEQAVRNPGTINMNIVYAQQARQIIDVLVGFHISPQLWKNVSYNSKNALSAGRCQTPALRLLYDNEREIRANPGNKTYKVTGYFTNLCIPFELNEDIKATTTEEDEEIIKFLEYSAENVNKHIYTHTNPERTYKTPPEPFTTSRLQQVSSNEMHISPKETMKICQTLYEGGYITYMRTDSNKYSGEFLEAVTEYILKTYDEKHLHKNINIHLLGEKIDIENNTKNKLKSKKESKESKENTIGGAHEAIRPTNIKRKDLQDDKLTPREKKMYKLIWRNTLQSCMANAEYNSFTCKVRIGSDSTVPTNTKKSNTLHPYIGYYYKYHTEQLVFAGWKIADPSFSPTPSSQSEKNYIYLLNLPDNSQVLYKKITANLTIKNQKQHYTEAKLIQLLEEKGIGRPSTFSMLIDKIQEKEYALKQNVKGQTIVCKDYEIEYDEVKKEASDIYEIECTREIGNEKNKLVIQPLGMIVLDFLENHFFSLFDYNFTEKMENDLDKVAKGEKDYNDVCGECLNEINKLINSSVDKCESTDLEDTNTEKSTKSTKSKKIEYKIDDTHFYIIGKNGPVIKCINNDCVPSMKEESTFLSTTSIVSGPKEEEKGKQKNKKSILGVSNPDIKPTKKKTGKKQEQNISFLSIRKDIVLDMDKLKRGEYKLSDLVDGDIDTTDVKKIEYKNERNLGRTDKFPEADIIVKLGRYGMYAVYGENKKSLSCFGNRPLSNLTLEEVVEVLFGKTDSSGTITTPQSKIMRKITDDVSIRDGKYGNYIFYKTSYMKKPRFISINGYKGNIIEDTEETVKKWIRENCHINI
jgi:DNA topoisomerase-1